MEMCRGRWGGAISINCERRSTSLACVRVLTDGLREQEMTVQIGKEEEQRGGGACGRETGKKILVFFLFLLFDFD